MMRTLFVKELIGIKCLDMVVGKMPPGKVPAGKLPPGNKPPRKIVPLRLKKVFL